MSVGARTSEGRTGPAGRKKHDMPSSRCPRVRRIRTTRAIAMAVALTVAAIDVPAAHATFSGTLTGTLPSGATYLIEVPPDWNGTPRPVQSPHTLRRESGGRCARVRRPPGGGDAVTDPVTHAWLLSHGHALAGSSYANLGWAVQEAFADQIAVLDLFASQVAPPQRTIACRQSMGGLITAGFVQMHPERFAGALLPCGLLAGGVAAFDAFLDAAPSR